MLRIFVNYLHKVFDLKRKAMRDSAFLKFEHLVKGENLL